MALECLTTQTFSTASDVWSLACFMVEVFTNGEPPFAGKIIQIQETISMPRKCCLIFFKLPDHVLYLSLR